MKNVNEISEDFFELMMFLHKKLFNPRELTKDLPMPMSHFKVLYFLSIKDTVSPSDIAAELNINRSNLTPILDYLITENLIIKYLNPDDKRYHIIEITEKGKNSLYFKTDIVRSKLYNHLVILNNDDLNKLSESIDNMYKIIKKLDETSD